MDVGLSQQEVADRSGIHLTHISNLERGKASPNYDTLRRLAKGLELPSPTHILVQGELIERRKNHG